MCYLLLQVEAQMQKKHQHHDKQENKFPRYFSWHFISFTATAIITSRFFLHFFRFSSQCNVISNQVGYFISCLFFLLFPFSHLSLRNPWFWYHIYEYVSLNFHVELSWTFFFAHHTTQFFFVMYTSYIVFQPVLYVYAWLTAKKRQKRLEREKKSTHWIFVDITLLLLFCIFIYLYENIDSICYIARV